MCSCVITIVFIILMNSIPSKTNSNLPFPFKLFPVSLTGTFKPFSSLSGKYGSATTIHGVSGVSSVFTSDQSKASA